MKYHKNKGKRIKNFLVKYIEIFSKDIVDSDVF